MKKNREAAFQSGGRPSVFWAVIKRLAPGLHLLQVLTEQGAVAEKVVFGGVGRG